MSYNWNWDPVEFDFDKTVNTNVSTTIKFDTDIYFDKSFHLNGYVNFANHVEGNTANLVVDAEAIGYDTLVEVDASVLTTYDYSGITLSVVSAVN